MHDPSRAAQIDARFEVTQTRRVARYATCRYCRLYASPCTPSLARRRSRGSAPQCPSTTPQAIIRFEHLADDLIATMRAASCPVDEKVERTVRERAAKPVNDSDYKPYWEYYDDPSRHIVRRRVARDHRAARVHQGGHPGGEGDLDGRRLVATVGAAGRMVLAPRRALQSVRPPLNAS